MQETSNFKKFLVSLIAVLVGMGIGSVIMLLSGNNPLLAFTAIIDSTMGSLYATGEWIAYSVPIILTGLSVGFAYRANLFNIGAEGQFIVGATTAVLIGGLLELSDPIHMFVALTAGVIMGAMYASIAGFLKAYYGVSEVVVTIMLNYIALKFQKHIITTYFHTDTIVTRTPMIAESASLDNAAMETFFQGARVNNAVFFVALAVFVYWYLLNKTTYGYQVKAVGFSMHASRYAGINEKRKIISTMAIAGGFAGLSGSVYALSEGFLNASSSFLNIGFDGIAVALLGQLSAIGIVLAGLLFGALRGGAAYMPGVPTQIIDIMIGVIIIFSAMGTIILKKISSRRSK